MSSDPIQLPDNGPSIAGTNDGDGDFVQTVADIDVKAAIQDLYAKVEQTRVLLASIDAKTSSDQATGADLAAIQVLLTNDPPTAAGISALKTSVDGLAAQFAGDPALGADVAALQAVVADLLSRTTTDPATGADMGAVLAAVQALTAKVPTGGATDAHIDLVTAAVNAAASVLPTGAATETTLANIRTTLEALNAKAVTGAATEAGLTALGVKLDALATHLASIEVALADVATGADIATVVARLTTDPPTGADLAAIETDLETAVAKLSSDPATAAGVAALKASVDALTAKTSADQATGADMDAVVAELQAILADIPAGAATDAAITALGTVVTSAAAILPTGAATEASVDDIETLLTAINNKVISGAATEATLASSLAKLTEIKSEITATLAAVGQTRDRLPAAIAASGGLKVDVQGTPPLPSGAATLAKQDALIAAITLVQSAVEGIPAAPTTVDVGNWPTTQPVSLASSPLPAGAATSAKQDALISAIALVESAVGAIPAAPSTVAVNNLPADPATNTTLTEVRDRVVLPSSLTGGRLAVDSLPQPVRRSDEATFTGVASTVELDVLDSDQAVSVYSHIVSGTSVTIYVRGQWIDAGGTAREVTLMMLDPTSSAATSPYINYTITSGIPRLHSVIIPPGITKVVVRCTGATGSGNAKVRLAAGPHLPLGANQGVNMLSVPNISPSGDGTVSQIRLGSPSVYNGTTYDKVRNNTVPVLFSGAPRPAAEQMSSDTRTWNASALRIVGNVFDMAGSGASLLTFTLQAFDIDSYGFYNLMSASLTPSDGDGAKAVIEMGLGCGAGAKVSASRPVPHTFRLIAEHDGSTDLYYGATAELIV